MQTNCNVVDYCVTPTSFVQITGFALPDLAVVFTLTVSAVFKKYSFINNIDLIDTALPCSTDPKAST